MKKQSTPVQHKRRAHPVLDGARLRVRADEYTYEGWGRTRDGSLLLYDARRGDGERFDTVLIEEFTAVERLGGGQTVEELAPSEVKPSPYDARNVDVSDVDPTTVPPERHRQLYRHQRLLSYPIAVRSTNSPHELVAGHRRVGAAARAEFGDIPVRLVDVADWTATQMFVHEHFPYPQESHDDPEVYGPEEMSRSFERLREDWSDDRLRTLLPLRPLFNEDITDPYP